MPRSGLTLFVFGSSLTSSYWNGAATYYRGLYRELHRLGYRVLFAEPDIYGRQQHRDAEHVVDYAEVRVYPGRERDGRRQLTQLLREARAADLIIKHSGVGEDDDWLEAAVLDAAAAAPAGSRPRVAFWDVDAPATLASLDADRQHPLRALLPGYDYVFTYGGGPPVVAAYLRHGARSCYPVYNALDPSTHRPAAPEPAWQADLGFLGHRLPDREMRVRRFFMDAAQRLPQSRFLLGGEGWGNAALPGNVRWLGHVPTAQHNQFNASTRMVLNVNRLSMARAGFSPPTRIFEAAGAAACVITDAWPGIELFFQPEKEILVAADGRHVAHWLQSIDAGEAQRIGLAMRRRALEEHTYQRRAQRVDRILQQGIHSQKQAA